MTSTSVFSSGFTTADGNEAFIRSATFFSSSFVAFSCAVSLGASSILEAVFSSSFCFKLSSSFRTDSCSVSATGV